MGEIGARVIGWMGARRPGSDEGASEAPALETRGRLWFFWPISLASYLFVYFGQ
jgi:hypothetical protein